MWKGHIISFYYFVSTKFQSFRLSISKFSQENVCSSPSLWDCRINQFVLQGNLQIVASKFSHHLSKPNLLQGKYWAKLFKRSVVCGNYLISCIEKRLHRWASCLLFAPVPVPHLHVSLKNIWVGSSHNKNTPIFFTFPLPTKAYHFH